MAVTAYCLLLYTGARLSEIQTLRWEYIRGNRIHLPDSKTGAKTIPLNAPSLEVLANAQRIAGNPYVVAGAKEGEYQMCPMPNRLHLLLAEGLTADAALFSRMGWRCGSIS